MSSIKDELIQMLIKGFDIMERMRRVYMKGKENFTNRKVKSRRIINSKEFV